MSTRAAALFAAVSVALALVAGWHWYTAPRVVVAGVEHDLRLGRPTFADVEVLNVGRVPARFEVCPAATRPACPCAAATEAGVAAPGERVRVRALLLGSEPLVCSERL